MSRFMKENIWSAVMLQRGYSRATSQNAFFQHLSAQGGPPHAGLSEALDSVHSWRLQVQARTRNLTSH